MAVTLSKTDAPPLLLGFFLNDKLKVAPKVLLEPCGAVYLEIVIEFKVIEMFCYKALSK